jgi:plasmid stabilization system protein ParE
MEPESFCSIPLPYIAVYRVKEQDIEVLRIYHAAQDRP